MFGLYLLVFMFIGYLVLIVFKDGGYSKSPADEIVETKEHMQTLGFLLFVIALILFMSGALAWFNLQKYYFEDKALIEKNPAATISKTHQISFS